MPDADRMLALLTARYPVVSVTTVEEDDALNAVTHAAIEAKLEALCWSASAGVHDALVTQTAAVPDSEHPAAGLFYLTTLPQRRRVIVLLDLVGHLKDERTLRQWREVVKVARRDGSTIVMIDHQSERPDVVNATAVPFELSFPDAAELEQIVRSTVRQANDVSRVQTELTRADLDAFIRNLKGLSRRQARQVVMDAIANDNKLCPADIPHALAVKRKLVHSAGLLEFVESPVSLDQIGGLTRLKAWLADRQHTTSDAAASYGLTPPRGILLLGVQGAGKSLAAKAVATGWKLPLLRMDVGALYDRFIGESERRLRDTLHQAGMMSPNVLWIDEIEKAFASAASRSVDGGLSQRMFGALLTWMQEHTHPVFLVATANDIEALPPELLRKGRFDEIFFVDLPTADARRQIFAIHLRKRNRDPAKFDLDALTEESDGFSGAEIEQAVVAALHRAFAGGREPTSDDLRSALAGSPPLSVTMRERVAALRRWAEGRCVPAD